MSTSNKPMACCTAWYTLCECSLSAEEVGESDSNLNAVDSEELPITLL